MLPIGINTATYVHLQCKFSLSSECRYSTKGARGNETSVLSHIYQWVEFCAVSSHRHETISARPLFNHFALNTETASFFKMMEKQAHHNNVTTQKCEYMIWSFLNSHKVSNCRQFHNGIWTYAGACQSSCHHSLLLNRFAHNHTA